MPQPLRQCPSVLRHDSGRMWKRAGYGGAGGGGRSDGAETGCLDQAMLGSRCDSGGCVVIGGSGGDDQLSGELGRNGGGTGPGTVTVGPTTSACPGGGTSSCGAGEETGTTGPGAGGGGAIAPSIGVSMNWPDGA